MEICSSLLSRTLPTLAYGGTSQRRWKFGRDLLFGHCCLLLLVLFCWLQTPVQGAPWRNIAKSDDSDEGYYETDGSYETDEEIEYEEHDHHPHHQYHLPNGVSESDESGEDQPDSFNNAELLAQLGIHQKTPREKKKKSRKLPPPVTIAVPYPVHIERKVPVFIEKKVPVIVEKKVEVPVDRPYEVPVPVKVPVHEKQVIHVPKPIVFNVDRPYPVYVQRTVFVEKYRPFKVLIKSRTRY
ncbi:uncharacterized protein LOC118513520 isoform X2 [Anopheles stephensi]|uniref:uncharacterized protein LOC118513520 isoform X2 n=1 Tax=Anopheles stephensi TaxID=30069 RepID=UPI0016589327|nr:uncharacterized protein LOC118513520 isoform X2 [Anopheles stephensi]